MNPYLQLFRLGNCVMGVLGVLLAALIGIRGAFLEHLPELGVASAVVFFFIAAGNSLNDYVDRGIDKKAHPERPLPSGKLAPRKVLYLSGFLFIISNLLSLLLDLISFTIVISATVIMILYEGITKRKGLAGNLSISLLTGGLFLLGGAVVGAVERTLILALMAMLATLGREIIKDIEDLEADFDRSTLPKRIGVRNAGIVGSLALLCAVILSFVPYMTGDLGLAYLLPVFLADAIFIYCSIVHFGNPTRGQKLAKAGMMVALLAFLLGGFQIAVNGGFI